MRECPGRSVGLGPPSPAEDILNVQRSTPKEEMHERAAWAVKTRSPLSEGAMLSLFHYVAPPENGRAGAFAAPKAGDGTHSVRVTVPPFTPVAQRFCPPKDPGLG